MQFQCSFYKTTVLRGQLPSNLMSNVKQVFSQQVLNLYNSISAVYPTQPSFVFFTCQITKKFRHNLSHDFILWQAFIYSISFWLNLFCFEKYAIF